MAETRSLEVRQRESGVKSMGKDAAVWDCIRGLATKFGPSQGMYKDEEVHIEYVRLKPGETWVPARGPHDIRAPKGDRNSWVAVFGHGQGNVGHHDLAPGKLLMACPRADFRVEAGNRGLDFFAVAVPIGDDAEGVRVLARARLEPFVQEGIVVTRGTEFIFAPFLDVAEVLVPPGVTTSEHDLGVNERYLVLGGVGTMYLDGLGCGVKAGNVVGIPSGVMQYVRNDSPEHPLRFYCLCTPPFTPSTYGPGPQHGKVPPGFDLAEWWKSNAALYN